MKTKIQLSVLILAISTLFSAAVWADGVIRVVGVETNDVAAYVQQIARGQVILRRLNSPGTIRVLTAAYAGPNAGNVIVTIEYASMIELAEDEARGLADEGYRNWLAGLASIRTIVSVSIYRDISP
jgi:hypothetical protein